ncbi:MAG TPA: ABC transporter substrate-binding protein, partial [Acidimicrobiales bacterium]|nr:ABC transporter substrate-binding protein [Acidimicrobiales bacterium]
LESVVRVGDATGTGDRARAIVDKARVRLRAVTAAVGDRPRPRVFALEWSDPPFNGGHWVPEMIERAGGEPVLANPGTDSVRVTWDEIAAAAPDVIVFMPCGYGVEQAATEAAPLLERPELEDISAFFAVDATSFFSRPGPRLVDGVEILAAALHPDAVPSRADDVVRRLR